MKAYQIVEWGRHPEFVDVAVPTPGPGEVLLRMKGAGLCRSDLDLMEAQPGTAPYATAVPAGFTLGHENAGVVEAFGPGVTDMVEGESVVVHHMHSCGYCEACSHGHEQTCGTYLRGAIGLTRGVGMDGGLAPFLVVPRRELVKLGSLDPVTVSPLTDAGVTSYSAVKSVLSRLYPGTSALVIGLGGLGAYAVQFLKLLSPATVFGLDTTERRLDDGRRYGADHCFLSDNDAYQAIMDTTGGRGVDAIIDLVGTDQTLALAAAVSRPYGRIVLVGLEGGSLNVGWGTMATTCEFVISIGSTPGELAETCAIAASGELIIDLERFAFDDIELAYDRLRAGQLTGRAVIAFD